ncbi:MAG TPA: prepilin-type N-terminal cleavage/methylation domain-containing protein [Candidatus Ozemobacteraceae bacterium]|nr:prepilin-type N-terminal cleavage/methylation domain-containing protein [Candidatus Ozemobacteraceae bacterium]
MAWPKSRPVANRSGFTLMEIMVVIIVIAVLASVAGPMITSITDQGRASATKSKLSSLKSAILAYNGDVGRYPFWGDAAQVSCAVLYNSDANLFGDSIDNNILTCGSYGTGVINNIGGFVFNISKYSNQKWKGPYMDSEPLDFMYDSWGTRIRYFHYNKAIWLHAAGPDQTFDNYTSATLTNYTGDDIVLSVARTKF